MIRDNDIFWNNFDYYSGPTPFVRRPTATGDIPYPVGVGVLFLGGRRNVLEGTWLPSSALAAASRGLSVSASIAVAPAR